MENISYIVKMKMDSQHMRNTSVGNRFCENEQFPFLRLRVEIIETHHCPFCRKRTVMYRCDCKEFASRFAKLQEYVNDTKHKTELHFHPYENLLSQSKVTSTCIELLTFQEISELGPDSWDNAKKVVDMKTKSFFYVVNPTYKKGEITFIFKDLQTKEVYSCSLKGYYYKHHKIYLGIFYDEYVCRGDSSLIGNYSKEPRCKDFAIFDNWDTLCKKLKSIWKLVKGTHFKYLFLIIN